jgi:ZIP family zinc transporter
LIGISVLSSALLGWWLLRDLSDSILSYLFATGAGGMFYLTVTGLLPESEERHYQESAGLSVAAGFIIIFILSQFT